MYAPENLSGHRQSVFTPRISMPARAVKQYFTKFSSRLILTSREAAAEESMSTD
jgi:hypothetical protein